MRDCRQFKFKDRVSLPRCKLFTESIVRERKSCPRKFLRGNDSLEDTTNKELTLTNDVAERRGNGYPSYTVNQSGRSPQVRNVVVDR